MVPVVFSMIMTDVQPVLTGFIDESFPSFSRLLTQMVGFFGSRRLHPVPKSKYVLIQVLGLFGMLRS